MNFMSIRSIRFEDHTPYDTLQYVNGVELCYFILVNNVLLAIILDCDEVSDFLAACVVRMQFHSHGSGSYLWTHLIKIDYK